MKNTPVAPQTKNVAVEAKAIENQIAELNAKLAALNTAREAELDAKLLALPKEFGFADVRALVERLRKVGGIVKASRTKLSADQKNAIVALFKTAPNTPNKSVMAQFKISVGTLQKIKRDAGLTRPIARAA